METNEIKTTVSENGRTTREMTMHQLLCQIKLTKSKLDTIPKKAFISCKRHSDTVVDGNVPVETSKDIMTGNLQSILHLISNLSAYEKVRYESNANTDVKIGNVTMKVSDAIKRKENIKYEQALLNEMEKQYNGVCAVIQKENDKLESAARQKIEAMKTDTMDPKVLDEIMTKDIESRRFEAVDPNDLLATIRSMRDELEKFTSEVDAALSTSNAITVVKVTTYD